MGIKILFTTPILEHPAAGGPALRIINSIKALDVMSELHVISRCGHQAIGGADAEAYFCSTSSAFGYAPHQKGTGDHVGETRNAKAIVQYAHRQQIAIIWCGYGNISHTLLNEIKRLNSSLKVVCDTDAVWSRFVLRELPFESDPARRKHIYLEGRAKEREEAEWVELCDVITAVSEVDATYYRHIARDKSRIHIFPNAIDLDSYSNAPEPACDVIRPALYMAGSFYAPGSPMARAARWMIAEILPLVRREIPQIRLYVIGNGADKMLEDIHLPQVIIKGKVPSVLPYLCHCDVALVPLMFESGTRFKILEAAACGIPVVSTTLGAEGLAMRHGYEILIADEPADFAASIVRLVRDKEFARGLARNAKRIVQNAYGIASLKEAAMKILAYLTGENRLTPPHLRNSYDCISQSG